MGRKIFGVIALIIAGLLIRQGMIYHDRVDSFLSRAVITEGTVVRYQMEHVTRPGGGGDNWSEVAVVSFEDASGQISEAPINVGSHRSAWEIGTKLPIAYDPNFMQDVRLRNFRGLWLVPSVFLLPGSLILLFGLWRLFR